MSGCSRLPPISKQGGYRLERTSVFTKVFTPTDGQLPADFLDRFTFEVAEPYQAEGSRFLSRILSQRADGVDRGKKRVAECLPGRGEVRSASSPSNLCQRMRLERWRIVKTNQRTVYAFAECRPGGTIGWRWLWVPAKARHQVLHILRTNSVQWKVGTELGTKRGRGCLSIGKVR
jgi:hypothetical protein